MNGWARVISYEISENFPYFNSKRKIQFKIVWLFFAKKTKKKKLAWIFYEFLRHWNCNMINPSPIYLKKNLKFKNIWEISYKNMNVLMIEIT